MSQNFLHTDREAHGACAKQPQHYVTNLIDAILSVISETEQHISAIPFIFIARKMTKSFIFRVIYNTKFSEIRCFN